LSTSFSGVSGGVRGWLAPVVAAAADDDDLGAGGNVLGRREVARRGEAEHPTAALNRAALGGAARRCRSNGLARTVGERLQELGLPLDGLRVPPPRKRRTVTLDRRIALTEEKRREASVALNMIRRAVEELGVGLVTFEEHAGPEAIHEAEVIITGIHKLADKLGGAKSTG
jgi:hypothetical protein